MPKTKRKGEPTPTKMGERILDFMGPLGLSKNKALFAEGTLGISRQTFHAWFYKDINPDKISARPMLLCAQALGTNAEYLLGISDDARVEHSLTYREAQLVEAYRQLDETDQDRLLRNATDWVGEAKRAPSTAAPFRVPLTPIITKATKR